MLLGRDAPFINKPGRTVRLRTSKFGFLSLKNQKLALKDADSLI